MSLRKTAIAVAVTAAIGLTGTAFAGYAEPVPASGHWYISGNVGGTFPSDYNDAVLTMNYDNGYGAAFAVGYKDNSFRYEGELVYLTNELNNFAGIDIDAFFAMFNVIYDFENVSDSVTPYIGLGIGYGEIDANSGAVASENHFVYGGRLGLAIKVADNTDLDVGYRYFRTSDLDGTSTPYENHYAMVGLTFHLA